MSNTVTVKEPKKSILTGNARRKRANNTLPKSTMTYNLKGFKSRPSQSKDPAYLTSKF